MTNNISLIKIKSFLSWRGLFPLCHSLSPFCHSRILLCHSREGGNPSFQSLRRTPSHVIARERNDRSNLNLSGFSLIELMVAVVILAMAILGIFQAYSVGFMGIADARDRTVATNYLQESIEDFKNKDFNQVKNEPITPIPNTKFSRGTYVLNLEVMDGVVTLKKVITQVRWINRKGNIETEKVSTIIYNKPDTSEVGEAATELVLYAESYYTILPEYNVNLIAEIKDENGNIYNWNGTIEFSVTTDPVNTPPVGSLNSSSAPAVNGIASCIFTAVSGDNVEGTEKIQASATVDGNVLTDTVNIRVTTGPVGIVIEPASEGDRILAAGVGIESNINLYVVKADYETLVEYSSPITLSAIGPGTLSDTTISSVPTDGTSFIVTSNNTPGIVEITASAPDLDLGYTEIIFTGEPASIIITPEKNAVYPDEEIDITVMIVDGNNYPVEYTGNVNLSADPNYGNFGTSTLSFTSSSFMSTTFTANGDAPVGETITLQAESYELTDSADLIILSSLTPTYLDIFAFPFGIDLNIGGSSTITAKVYDINGNDIVTTYNTPITFYSKIGVEDFGTFSNNIITPTEGEAVTELSSYTAGTATITASSGDLILRPEGGRQVVFYQSAHHIELSADPLSIQADGHETSIITATVCDVNGNKVANYNKNGDKSITLTTTKGGFPNNGNLTTISSNSFDEGQILVEFLSMETGTAEVTALSSDGLEDNGSIPIELTGEVPTVVTLGEVTNQDDYLISFDITVTGSPLYLEEIKVEWDNSNAPLDEIIIYSPYPLDENPLTINTYDSYSPCTKSGISKTLVTTGVTNIGLNFRNGVSKMKQKNITVTFTDEDTSTYAVSFRVPNM